MNRAIMIIGMVLLAMFAIGNIVPAQAGSQVLRTREETQRAQITGYGTTAIAAISDARQNAAKVAETYSFNTVKQRVFGAAKDWTCVLIIEFKVRKQ